MTEKLHICQKCRSQMFKKFNSSIWVCFECEKKAKSVKSKPTITKKVTVKKTGLKNKKPISVKSLEKELDKEWSLLVKLRAGMKCEYCGNRKQLNSHHLNSRAKRTVRWDVSNGISLCVNHHIGSEFSAHKTSIQFTMWLIKYKGQEFMDNLNWKASQTSHLSFFEKEIILDELRREIEKYK